MTNSFQHGKVIHSCLAQGVINATESELFLNMVDDRNTTSHLYDRATADAISKNIGTYFELMRTIEKRIVDI